MALTTDQILQIISELEDIAVETIQNEEKEEFLMNEESHQLTVGKV